MVRAPFTLSLDPEDPRPLYLRVASALGQAIRQGRLRPGAQLPSTRALARSLEVNRNTLLAAFRELEAEGWIQGSARSGTYVSPVLPQEAVPCGAAALKQAAFPLAEPFGPLTEHAPAGFLDLREGLPDMRLLGVELLGRAYRRAMAQRGRELLERTDPRGFLPFRRAVASLLTQRRGTAYGPQHLLLCKGHRSALEVVLRGLLHPGETLAVEDPGHPKVRDLAKRLGLALLPIPVDQDGLQVEALHQALERQPIRLLHLTPFAQYPTTVPLARSQRCALLDLAFARGFAILEDDGELGLGCEPSPRPALAAEDERGSVIHLGGFNRVLAPHLPLAFLGGPEDLIEHLCRLQGGLDGPGDPVLACALADLLVEGEVDRHLLRLQQVLQARRDHLALRLAEHLSRHFAFTLPPGGGALWIQARRGLDLDRFVQRCRAQGLLFHPGSRWSHAAEPLQATRLGFLHLQTVELDEVVKRMARALAQGV